MEALEGACKLFWFGFVLWTRAPLNSIHSVVIFARFFLYWVCVFGVQSGGLPAAQLHVARTLCRRAERRVTELVHNGDVPDVVAKYLNRLSDYLFVAARFAAQENGTPEQVYKKGTGVASSSAEIRTRTGNAEE